MLSCGVGLADFDSGGARDGLLHADHPLEHAGDGGGGEVRPDLHSPVLLIS